MKIYYVKRVCLEFLDFSNIDAVLLQLVNILDIELEIRPILVILYAVRNKEPLHLPPHQLRFPGQLALARPASSNFRLQYPLDMTKILTGSNQNRREKG